MRRRENKPANLNMRVNARRQGYLTWSLGHGIGWALLWRGEIQNDVCGKLLENTHFSARAWSLTLEIRPKVYSLPGIQRHLGGGD